MARARKTTSRSKARNSVSVDFSNVGKQFEPGQEYPVEIVECTLEDGNKAPYFNIKMKGVDEEYESSFLYHKASTSEGALWRLRSFLEAFEIEIPDGPMDLSTEDFIGKQAMCATFLDKYEGGSSVKADDFWPLDGDYDSEDGKAEDDEEPAEFDLSELDNDEIAELAEAAGIKAKSLKAQKRALAKMDADELAELYEGLGEDEEEDEPEEKPKSKSKSKSKKKAASVDEDEIKEMNEDELEEFIEEHELDVDLDDYKTLSKKKAAVLDAAEEAGLLD